jgi:hypothetical protein
MYPAVIMILRSVGLLMQMMLTCWAQMAILLVSTCLHTAEITLYRAQIAMDISGILLRVPQLVG